MSPEPRAQEPIRPNVHAMMAELQHWPRDERGNRDIHAAVHFMRGPPWWRITRRALRALRLPRQPWA